MKKTTIVAIMLMVLVLTGCGHEHTWKDANCTSPKTCTECGETEGVALEHTWTEATCTAPKTCKVCGATEGIAIAHTWTDADCVTAKTCSVCGTTEGSPLGHSWVDATYEAPKTCSVCEETEGEPLVETLEHYIMVSNPEMYEGVRAALQTVVDENNGVYKDAYYVVTENEIAQGFVFQDGINIKSGYWDSIRESTLESVRNDFDVYEDEIGIRPTKVAYIFFDSNMNVIVDYTIEE